MERKRDYSFEALVEVSGADLQALTQDERGRINAALKQLRALVPDDYVLSTQIHDRAAAWRVAYPDISITPQALTGAWSSIEQKAADTRRSQTKAVNVMSPTGECLTCDGDKMVVVSHRPSLNERSAYEEMAPCPDCNSGADAGFWRADGSRFSPPRPEEVRELIGQ